MSQIIYKAKFKKVFLQQHENPELIIDRAEIARLVEKAERTVSIHVQLPANCLINGYPVTWGTETK